MTGFFKHWRKRDDAVVALEFALLSIPFFIMLMGIIEMSVFFASGIVLEGATAEAARLIRTGQLEAEADPEAAFADALCEHADALLDCDKLRYESIVINEGTFAAAGDYTPQFDANGNLIPSGFSTGGSENVILVRVAYRYEFLMPLIGGLMTGDPTQNWMNHISVAVIKNEPFEFGS